MVRCPKYCYVVITHWVFRHTLSCACGIMCETQNEKKNQICQYHRVLLWLKWGGMCRLISDKKGTDGGKKCTFPTPFSNLNFSVLDIKPNPVFPQWWHASLSSWPIREVVITMIREGMHIVELRGEYLYCTHASGAGAGCRGYNGTTWQLEKLLFKCRLRGTHLCFKPHIICLSFLWITG